MPRRCSSRGIRPESPALKKIGALSEGSKIQAPEAQETSHLFFEEATSHIFGFMATHPPLDERIRRIDPSFNGDFSQVKLPPEPKAVEESPGKTGHAPFRFNPAEMIGRIGTLDPQQIAFATQLLDSLPTSLREIAQTPYGARAIVFALLLDRENSEVRACAAHWPRTTRRAGCCATAQGRSPSSFGTRPRGSATTR